MSQEDTHPAEGPVAETPAETRDFQAEVALLAQGLDRMHAIYRELAQNLSSEKIFESLIAGLSCHPNFIELTRKLVLETNAEFISQHQQEHSHELVISEHEGVSGYSVALSRSQLEHSMLRAGINDNDHPTRPGKVEAFLLHEGQWSPVGLPPLMAAAIEAEFHKSNAQPYTYYWVDLTAYSAEPLSEASQPVVASEHEDGQAG